MAQGVLDNQLCVVLCTPLPERGLPLSYSNMDVSPLSSLDIMYNILQISIHIYFDTYP